jgi:DNA-binding protein Fis
MEELMETQTTQTTLSNSVEIKAESISIDVSALPTLGEVERLYLNLVLEKTGNNKVKAAALLGVSVKTIYNKLDSYKANSPG